MTRDGRDGRDEDEDDGHDGADAAAPSFARLVDAMMSGSPPPPAMEADERALLETATLIHAATHAPPAGAASVIDRAMAKAGLGPRASGLGQIQSPDPAPRLPGSPAPPVTGHRLRRTTPWALSALFAAAAAVLLVIRPHTTARPPISHCSRPADDLVGAIPAAHADQARARLDAIYADRLAGYRELTLFARAP